MLLCTKTKEINIQLAECGIIVYTFAIWGAGHCFACRASNITYLVCVPNAVLLTALATNADAAVVFAVSFQLYFVLFKNCCRCRQRSECSRCASGLQLQTYKHTIAACDLCASRPFSADERLLRKSPENVMNGAFVSTQTFLLNSL